MILTPGQDVLVLDTSQKPIGTGRVESFDAETEECIVLFTYPNQDKPESIPVPIYRLIPVKEV